VGDHELAIDDPSFFYDNAEAALSQQDALYKAVLLFKTHDRPLLIKLYYRDASGREYKSMFKPNIRKISGNSSYTYRPGPIEHSFNALAKKLAPYSEFRSAPLQMLAITKEKIISIAKDDPDTKVDERRELIDALNGVATYTSEPVYQNGNQLVGSNMLWMTDIAMVGNNRDQWRSKTSSLDPRSSRDLSIIQLFLLDYITANNDRAGNIFKSNVTGLAWAIDNDDSFVAASAKKYCQDIAAKVANPGRDFLSGLRALNDMSSQQWEAIFAYHSSSQRDKYIEQTRSRIKSILRRF